MKDKATAPAIEMRAWRQFLVLAEHLHFVRVHPAQRGAHASGAGGLCEASTACISAAIALRTDAIVVGSTATQATCPSSSVPMAESRSARAVFLSVLGASNRRAGHQCATCADRQGRGVRKAIPPEGLSPSHR